MISKIYGAFMMNGKRVNCIDEAHGFSLEIEGQKYHVYANKGTHVDLVVGDKREYIGKVNDFWTGDEMKAAKFILSYKELIAELERRGYTVSRSAGSR